MRYTVTGKALKRSKKRTCHRKVAYPTEREARLALRRLRDRDVRGLLLYRCDIGPLGSPRHWHVGHLR